MKNVLIYSLILLLILIFGCNSRGSATISGNRFTDTEVGMEIIKPSNWYYLDFEEYWSARSDMKFNEAEFQKMKDKKTNIPFYYISKHPFEYEGVNSICEITRKDIKRLPDKSISKIWEIIMPGFEKALQNYEIIKDPYEMTVSNKKVSVAEMTFLLETESGVKEMCFSKFVIWVKGNYLYHISFSCPETEQVLFRSDMKYILDNIKIL